MAVVMALAVVLLMVTVAMELHLNQRASLINAAAMRDRTTLNEMATSGIHMAMALLVNDRINSESDSIQEDWADEEAVAALMEQLPFDQGQVNVKIIDELGKIQINALVKFPEGQQFNETQHQLWERFSSHMIDLYQILEQLGEGTEADQDELEEIEPLTIINSIKDWIDSGDDEAITGLNGAESDYYEALDPPYVCKNGPFDDLSEVRLVQGITPGFFEGFGGAAGLSSYITVYGAVKADDDKFTFPGQININTAELPVLAALLPTDNADFAELLVAYREAVNGDEYTNNLSSKEWYKNVPGFAGITIDPDQITVSSDTYRITASAQLNELTTTLTAVVQRQKPTESAHWQCKVLNWKQD
jgi:general secretion pathway protein K